jgi:hypothetical protein
VPRAKRNKPSGGVENSSQGNLITHAESIAPIIARGNDDEPGAGSQVDDDGSQVDDDGYQVDDNGYQVYDVGHQVYDDGSQVDDDIEYLVSPTGFLVTSPGLSGELIIFEPDDYMMQPAYENVSQPVIHLDPAPRGRAPRG